MIKFCVAYVANWVVKDLSIYHTSTHVSNNFHYSKGAEDITKRLKLRATSQVPSELKNKCKI